MENETKLVGKALTFVTLGAVCGLFQIVPTVYATYTTLRMVLLLSAIWKFYLFAGILELIIFLFRKRVYILGIKTRLALLTQLKSWGFRAKMS